MNKWLAGSFAAALFTGAAIADVGAPAPTAKDMQKEVDEVYYVETSQPGIVLGGYVDVGYIYNFTDSGFNNRFPQENTVKGDFNVNAVKLTLEKALPEENVLAAGFRVDLMIGEDASGLGGTGGADTESFLTEQAYVTVRAPWGNGVDFKAGKFVTWLGYEVIERPANMNISYGNLFQNMIPLTHVGLSAEYAVNDMIDTGFAIVNGLSDDNFGNDGAGDGYAIEAKVNVTNPGGNANWFNAVYYSWDSSFEWGLENNEGQTIVYDTWGNWAPVFAGDKLLLGVNADLGYADLNNGTSTWWGAALYAKYQLTDIISIAGRGDYMHVDGVPSKFITAGGDGDIWSWTGTVGFDLLENLLLRTEYRLDWGDSVTAVASDGPGHTFAAQVVYSF